MPRAFSRLHSRISQQNDEGNLKLLGLLAFFTSSGAGVWCKSSYTLNALGSSGGQHECVEDKNHEILLESKYRLEPCSSPWECRGAWRRLRVPETQRPRTAWLIGLPRQTEGSFECGGHSDEVWRQIRWWKSVYLCWLIGQFVVCGLDWLRSAIRVGELHMWLLVAHGTDDIRWYRVEPSSSERSGSFQKALLLGGFSSENMVSLCTSWNILSSFFFCLCVCVCVCAERRFYFPKQVKATDTVPNTEHFYT